MLDTFTATRIDGSKQTPAVPDSWNVTATYAGVSISATVLAVSSIPQAIEAVGKLALMLDGYLQHQSSGWSVKSADL